MKMILSNIRLVVILFIMCSVIYTVVIRAIGAVVFPGRSEGSLIVQNGKVVGSELLGQEFTQPGYFHGRPSAVNYNAAGSGGSNLAVTNPGLYARMADTVSAAAKLDGLSTGTIAFDRVTASGSGLDPHITPANAEQQVARIARERNIAKAAVRQMVDEHIEPPLLGIFGQEKVNVLALNLALDRELPTRQSLQ